MHPRHDAASRNPTAWPSSIDPIPTHHIHHTHHTHHIHHIHRKTIMKFISFQINGRASYGLARGNGIVDLGTRLAGDAPTLKDLIATGRMQQLASPHADAVADFQRADVDLLPPIPQPSVIACVGHNYEEHRLETQRDPTEHPSIFFRHPESLRGCG